MVICTQIDEHRVCKCIAIAARVGRMWQYLV